MITASVTCKAQFFDLDPMQVVWHGNYPRFLELARCALMEKIGYSYDEMAQSGYLWPIVDMRLKYVRSVVLAQEIEVKATLVDYEHRLKIDYRISDAKTGEVLTKAQTTQVAITADKRELSLESPPLLIDRVQALLAS